MNLIHYIETSALNLFADELLDFEFNVTYQTVMRVDLCISPVVLWEVLLNAEDSRRERLIYWAQINCARYILKSPSEIIIQYLRAGAPVNDRDAFHRSRATELTIGKAWSGIHGKLDRTILFNFEDLQARSKPLRDFSRCYRDVMMSMTDESAHGNNGDYFHRMMIKLHKVLEVSDNQERRSDALTKTSLVLGFLMVCVGVDLDNTSVRNYWATFGLEDPSDRLDFLVECQPIAFVRGPLMEMALMMHTQTEMPGGTNRGAAFDAMHSIYCYYAHNTVANDSHFTKLAKYTGSEIYENVIRADRYVEMIKVAQRKLNR